MRDQKRGGLLEGESVGHGPDLTHGHDGFFGVAAGAHLRDHLLPDGNTIDIRSDLGNDAGRLQTRHERQLRAMLVKPLDHQHIGKVDAGGLERNPHVARPQRTPGQTLQAQAVRRTQFPANDGTIGFCGHVRHGDHG